MRWKGGALEQGGQMELWNEVGGWSFGMRWEDGALE